MICLSIIAGNPLLISSVVTFRVVAPAKAHLDCGGKHVEYVRNQALTVMKRVSSMYPYEAAAGQHSLKTEAEHVREMMVSFLQVYSLVVCSCGCILRWIHFILLAWGVQEKCIVAGVEIISFDLTDLSYEK